MKSLLRITPVFLFALLMAACGTRDSVQAEKECENCNRDDFYGPTVSEFMEDVARYKTTHADLVSGSGYMKDKGLEASRSCWYSLDTLKKFICLIERYSKEAGIKNPSSLGIRFYYGVYPQNMPSFDGHDYSSLHTLFMVPTIQEKNDRYPVDFDPRYTAMVMKENGGKLRDDRKNREEQRQRKPNDNNQDQTYQDNEDNIDRRYYTIADLDTSTKVLVLETRSAKAELMPKNQGQLCPPACSAAAASTLNTVDALYPSVDY